MACACQGKKTQSDNWTVRTPGKDPVTVKGQVAAEALAQRTGGTASPNIPQTA